MKIKNAILVLGEKDIKESLNSFISGDGITINEIKFTRENIEIRGFVKKVFTLDFSCNITVVTVNKDKIIIRVKDVKALKINLFSLIEKVVTGKGNKISLGRYLSIDKDLISINLDIVKCKLKDFDFEIEDIEIVKDGIEVKFDYVEMDLVMLLKKNMNSKKEKIVN